LGFDLRAAHASGALRGENITSLKPLSRFATAANGRTPTQQRRSSNPDEAGCLGLLAAEQTAPLELIPQTGPRSADTVALNYIGDEYSTTRRQVATGDGWSQWRFHVGAGKGL